AGDTVENFVKMIAQVFRVGAARAAILTLDPTGESGADTLDTHDVGSASAQPRVIGALAGQLGMTMKAMAETPFDSLRSLLEVTTFVFSAEFGRTLKQAGKPADATGTD